MIPSSATCAPVTSHAPMTDAPRPGAIGTIGVDEFFERISRQDMPMSHHAFRCPSCGTSMQDSILGNRPKGGTRRARARTARVTVQSPASFIRNFPFAKPEYATFACENAHRTGCPGWRPGGLLLISAVAIRKTASLFNGYRVQRDGTGEPIFDAATPDEARALARRMGAGSVRHGGRSMSPARRRGRLHGCDAAIPTGKKAPVGRADKTIVRGSETLLALCVQKLKTGFVPVQKFFIAPDRNKPALGLRVYGTPKVGAQHNQIIVFAEHREIKSLLFQAGSKGRPPYEESCLDLLFSQQGGRLVQLEESAVGHEPMVRKLSTGGNPVFIPFLEQCRQIIEGYPRRVYELGLDVNVSGGRRRGQSNSRGLHGGLVARLAEGFPGQVGRHLADGDGRLFVSDGLAVFLLSCHPAFDHRFAFFRSQTVIVDFGKTLLGGNALGQFVQACQEVSPGNRSGQGQDSQDCKRNNESGGHEKSSVRFRVFLYAMAAAASAQAESDELISWDEPRVRKGWWVAAGAKPFSNGQSSPNGHCTVTQAHGLETLALFSIYKNGLMESLDLTWKAFHKNRIHSPFQDSGEEERPLTPEEEKEAERIRGMMDNMDHVKVHKMVEAGSCS